MQAIVHTAVSSVDTLPNLHTIKSKQKRFAPEIVQRKVLVLLNGMRGLKSRPTVPFDSQDQDSDRQSVFTDLTPFLSCGWGYFEVGEGLNCTREKDLLWEP